MKDLINLYYVSSPSGKEKRMRKYIKTWLKNNVPFAVVKSDQSGIYVTKGFSDSYPCVVAHIDEVHNERNNDFRVVNADGILFGFDKSGKRQYGIGADDKNGIWVAMQCLKKYDVMKVALFVGEEIGCVGSSQADMDFFNDCRFVLQCDRKGSSDFITSAGGQELCDDDFLKRIDIASFGYKAATGLMTDVMELKEKGLAVAACNISCGYYNPHTSEEATIFSELENCRDLVFHIIDTALDVCLHALKRSYSGWYGYDYLNDYYNDDKWFSSSVVEKDKSSDIDEEFAELLEQMFTEMSFDPQGFDIVRFWDDWKYTFNRLSYDDFLDAYQETLKWAKEYFDDEDDLTLDA